MSLKREILVSYGRSEMKRPSRGARRFIHDQQVFVEDYHWEFVPRQDSVRSAYTDLKSQSLDTSAYRALFKSKKYFIFTSDIQPSRSDAVDLMFVCNLDDKRGVGCLILETEFLFFWRKEGL